MARRVKLTDFQRALSARLAEAASRQVASSNRLGVTTGQRQWLLRLDQAGEVLFIQRSTRSRTPRAGFAAWPMYGATW
jgi:hypothetical protein